MPTLEELQAERDDLDLQINALLHEVDLLDAYQSSKVALNTAIKGIYDGSVFRAYADAELSTGEKNVIIDIYDKLNP